MEYKRLFIFVEGSDDKRFFEVVIKPIFEKKYDRVELLQYANQSTKWKNRFLKSIKAMNADYVYAADIDNATCINSKKIKIQNEVSNTDKNRIIVVIKEIESWYLAGLTKEDVERLKLRSFESTDHITKEQFNRLISERFDSRIDYMLEILKCFSIKIATKKNKSFKYVIEKYKLMPQ